MQKENQFINTAPRLVQDGLGMKVKELEKYVRGEQLMRRKLNTTTRMVSNFRKIQWIPF